MHVIHTIVEFDGLIPIILAGERIEMIIASDLSGELPVRVILLTLRIKTEYQRLPRQVIEVVIDIKRFRHVIMLSSILHERLPHVREILPCHMVRYEINNHLYAILMRATNQLLELTHAVVHIIR